MPFFRRFFPPSFLVSEFPSYQVSIFLSFKVYKRGRVVGSEGGREGGPMRGLGTDHVNSGPMRGLTKKTASDG